MTDKPAEITIHFPGEFETVDVVAILTDLTERGYNRISVGRGMVVVWKGKAEDQDE